MNRADCVRRCLDCLRRQRPAATEVILIDASSDNRTALVASEFGEVAYFRTDCGYGHMTKSRNLGLSHVTGDIIVFVDDDAFVHEGWLAALMMPYSDPKVGGVGGRALNNQAGEELNGVEQIGRLLPDGTLTGYFAANPGKHIDVDHIIGCNMSWRREILTRLGGLRECFTGTEVREETDIALRVRALGYRIVFQPQAVVTHIGAPQVKGRRFDLRYTYYAQRNHMILLLLNFGWASEIVWRYLLNGTLQASGGFLKRVVASIAHLAAYVAGTIMGVLSGTELMIRPKSRQSESAPASNNVADSQNRQRSHKLESEPCESH